MKLITRKLGGVERKYEVYEPGEQCPYKAVYWQDIPVDNPEGLWAISDDGYICEVATVKEYRINRASQKTNKYIKLAVGASFVRPSVRLLIAPFLELGQGMSYTKAEKWINRQIKKPRVKIAVAAYVYMLLYGEKIDWNALGRIYHPKDYIPAASVRKLFRQEKVQEMVKEELKAILEKEGITESWVIQKAKKALEIAEANEDPGNMIKALPFFEKHLGMETQKVKQIESIEYDLKAIEEGVQTEENYRIKRESLKPLSVGELEGNRSDNEGYRDGNVADAEYEDIS